MNKLVLVLFTLLFVISCEKRLAWIDEGIVIDRGVSSIGFKHTSLTTFTMIQTTYHGIHIFPEESLYSTTRVGDTIKIVAVYYWNSSNWDHFDYKIYDKVGNLLLVTNPAILEVSK